MIPFKKKPVNLPLPLPTLLLPLRTLSLTLTLRLTSKRWRRNLLSRGINHLHIRADSRYRGR